MCRGLLTELRHKKKTYNGGGRDRQSRSNVGKCRHARMELRKPELVSGDDVKSKRRGF